jgi:arylsulfatase A-like enzyme
MFNAYEETINVPLVVSNPILFSEPAETDALASLVDVLPTVLTLAGGTADGAADLPGRDLTPILATAAKPERERSGRSPVDLAPVLERAAPAPTVQDAIHFTYDDHQAGTATQEAPGQPNRIRAIRTATHKYAWYYDPTSGAAAEHEMYDLDRDPIEGRNLVDVRSGEVRDPVHRAIREEVAERLAEAMREARTDPGVPPSYRAGTV